MNIIKKKKYQKPKIITRLLVIKLRKGGKNFDDLIDLFAANYYLVDY